ncbi:class I SAM-dependent methyltransferase [uncultured Nitratireductor sp.]|uniref:class I SAM-dependent methyltransferase n=1 Tax=uncultured Nitratireductor sp. TaxID=520953 RepID=UPI00261008E3|nr:class I SAM-dependent methyltransferase [uncultured Nitratireductor sp.]
MQGFSSEGSRATETLEDLYNSHRGKVSDKWTSYLLKYEEVLLPLRDSQVRLLEIGVQNGGSLEIWSRYFRNARHIVGCDVNPKCANLAYEDNRIALVIGNANDDSTEREIAERCPEFDVIIDDGSHQSADIIASFTRYFARLSDGGVFIAEDLHCSYWQRFGGGLYDPYSSISFFKRLLDVINSEHWGLPIKRHDALSAFAKKYSLRFDEGLLSSIYSIEFVNSMCIIRKRPVTENELGARRVVGSQAVVEKDVCEVDGQRSEPRDESGNPWALSEIPQEEEIEKKNTDLDQMKESLGKQEERIRELEQQVAVAQELRAEFETLLAGYKQHVDFFLEEMKARESQASARQEEVEKASKAAEGRLQKKVREVETRLQERFSEIATLSRLLREQEEQNTWLRSVAGAMVGDSRRGRLIGLLPGPLALALRKRQLKRRGLFDPEAYRRANPDVLQAGGDPFRHYILHGLNENRRLR